MRTTAVGLVVLAILPGLATTPAATATPVTGAAVGPAFGASGLVTTSARPDSSDFGTAVAIRPDQQVILAAGAGGDFGLVQYDEYLYHPYGFGLQDGKRVTDFGGTSDVARAVAVAADGGVVAAGSAGGDLAVARYDQHGILDRSFHGDGRLTVDLGGADDSAYALAPLADGRLLVVGGNASGAVVLRLLPDGSADTSFGGTGRVALPSPGPARAAALQPDGSLLVAGGGSRFTAYRLLADGSLDPGFGQGGTATIGAGPATANALVLGADGTVTLGGTRGADVQVARLTAAGQPDATFGTGGFTVSDFGAVEAGYGLAQRGDGTLMLVGDSGDHGLMVAYHPDGSLDTTFGVQGHFVTQPDPLSIRPLVVRLRGVAARDDGSWVVAASTGSDAFVGDPSSFPIGTAVDFGEELQRATSAAVQPDGKIVAVEHAGDGSAVVRYNPDGTRDGSFGLSGMVVSDRLFWPQGLALEPSGRIVLSGTSASDGSSAALLALTPAGTIDTSFGTDTGMVTRPAGGSFAGPSVATTPDGRLLLLRAPSSSQVVVDRFTADGRLDPTFAQGALVPQAKDDGTPTHMAVAPDGRIVVGGGARAIVRLNADGTPDVSFGVGGRDALAIYGFDLPATFTIQPDGLILVAAKPFPGGMSALNGSVLRLLADGTPDPSWQRPETPPSSPDSTIRYTTTITAQPDGTVLAAGNDGYSPRVTRRRPDGTFDPAFGTAGFAVIPVYLRADPVLVVQTQSSGLLVLATNDGTASTAGFQLSRIATGQLAAPVGVSAVAGSGSARVTWTRPPLFDESPIVAYRVTASDGVHSATTRDAAHLTAVVKGLTTGRAYTFTVQAVRQGVNAARSLPSNPVTPGLSSPMSAWGWNGAMQLGDGTAVDRPAPDTGVGVSGAIAVTGGAYHSMALRADGTVWTWGWNGLGELGDGTRTTRPTAVQVPGLSNVVAIASGAYHSMALRADGTVWTWGWNGFGQLGLGTSGDIQLSPVMVPGLTGVTAIGAGFHHSLAVRSDGTVVAWGWNYAGQLGDGTRVDSSRPKPVPGLTGITAVAGGALHSLALGSAGVVWAWGGNSVGQLATQDYVDRITPTAVASLPATEAIAAGAFHNYALLTDGTVSTWGWNGYGQLGNLTPGSVTWPQSVGYLSDVASIASGWFHGLAIRWDGSVIAWGDNRFGQLGDGTTTGRSEIAPVRVPAAVAIGAGAFQSLSA